MNVAESQIQILKRAALLVVLGSIIGIGVNAFRPVGSIPWTYAWSLRVESRARAEGIPVLPVEEVRQALASGTHLALDARSATEHATGTLPGALKLPRATFDEQFPQVVLFLSPEEPVITFCSSSDCDDALLLALLLREQGITNVFLFVDGIAAWKSAGYALESGL